MNRYFSNTDDIFDEVSPAIERAGLKANCLGGGKIIHDPEKKTLNVFGESTVNYQPLLYYKFIFDSLQFCFKKEAA